jgi:CubicO group peptidase (beta-lactamase class C family)
VGTSIVLATRAARRAPSLARPSGFLLCLSAVAVWSTGGCSQRSRSDLSERVTAGKPIPAEIITRALDRYHVPGVSIAVVHAGKIEWAEGYGLRESRKPDTVDVTTLFQAASISKPVSAALALRMVDLGLLALDEDVNRKLKSWKVPESEFTSEKPITLRNLLSHSAGLPMHGVPEFASGAPRPTLVQILEGTWSTDAERVRSIARPGVEYRYSGGGYIVLQLLLTDVADRPFERLAKELVLDPAGMSASTFEQPLPHELWNRAAVGHDRYGSPLVGAWHVLPEQAAGGLWTTPSDLASFMLSIWKSYHGQPGALLPEPLARQMLTRQIDDFGLGFYLPSSGAARFQHGGGNAGYRCFAVLSVDGGDGAVIMTNGDNGEPLIWDVYKMIGRAYGWSV